MKSEYLIRINYSVENLHRKHKFWAYVPSHDKSEHVSILRNCFAKAAKRLFDYFDPLLTFTFIQCN